MRMGKRIIAIGAVVMIGSVVAVFAQEGATPSDAADAVARTRLPADYLQLNLDDAVKAKILAIREKADADIRTIHDREIKDMQASLSPAQAAQLKSIDEKAASDARARRTQDRLQQRILTDQEKLDAIKNPALPPATNPSGN